jgi:hypothetical protein
MCRTKSMPNLYLTSAALKDRDVKRSEFRVGEI